MTTPIRQGTIPDDRIHKDSVHKATTSEDTIRAGVRQDERHEQQSERTGVSVVLPCYNESDNIQNAYESVVGSLSAYDLELVFIDDGSTDGTLSAIRHLAGLDPRVRYLSFTRNFGFEAAFSAGFRYSGKPWILQLDADMQFPATEAPKLIERALEGYDAVYGVRLHRHDSLVRIWASRAYHAVGGLLGIRIPHGATTFRVLNTGLATRIVDLRLATPYFMATVPRLTSRYTTVPVAHRPRLRGRSKFRLHQLAGHALDLYFGFSTRLRAAAIFLLLAAALGCLTMAVVTLAGVRLGPLLPTVSLLAAASSLACLAVVGRYMVMTYGALQRGPFYCVREANFAVAASDLLAPLATTSLTNTPPSTPVSAP